MSTKKKILFLGEIIIIVLAAMLYLHINNYHWSKEHAIREGERLSWFAPGEKICEFQYKKDRWILEGSEISYLNHIRKVGPLWKNIGKYSFQSEIGTHLHFLSDIVQPYEKIVLHSYGYRIDAPPISTLLVVDSKGEEFILKDGREKTLSIESKTFYFRDNHLLYFETFPSDTWEEAMGYAFFEHSAVKLIGYNEEEEEIFRWIK